MPTLTLQLAFNPTNNSTTQYGRFSSNSNADRVPSKQWLLSGFSGSTALSATVATGGTKYNVGDRLAVVGGVFNAPAQVDVSSVAAGGAITGVTLASGGVYSTQPGANPGVTGGAGTGATLTLTFGVGGPNTTSPDNPASPVRVSIATNPQVQILVQAVLPTGYAWNTAPGVYPLQISAVFGRGLHHKKDLQDYASAFHVPGAASQVCTLFNVYFTANGTTLMPAAATPVPGYVSPGPNQAVLGFGQPAFHDSTPGSIDVYEFNVGVVACLTTPSGAKVFTFGHDPDMQVDN